MTAPSADVKATYPPDTNMRIGTAVISAGVATVSVSGKIIDCSFVDPGDVQDGAPVVIFRNGAAWVCLGSVGAFPQQIMTGTESVSFTAQTSFTVAVTFPTVFAMVPNVHTNINSGIAATAGWGSRAITVTEAGFTLFVFGPSNTWAGISVQWTAVAR